MDDPKKGWEEKESMKDWEVKERRKKLIYGRTEVDGKKDLKKGGKEGEKEIRKRLTYVGI